VDGDSCAKRLPTIVPLPHLCSPLIVPTVAMAPPAPAAEPPERRLLVVGVDRGSAHFLRHLTSALDARGVDYDLDRVNLSRYRTALGERRVRVGRGPRGPIAGASSWLPMSSAPV
jgi:hypothetical protein